MGEMRYRVLVGAAVLSAVAGKTFAQATADSSTWEGQYQGTELPTADGFVDANPGGAITSVSGGFFHFNSETTESEDFYYLNGSNPFNFATGASWEWTLDVNDVTGAGGLFFAFNDPSGADYAIGYEPYYGPGGGYDVFLANGGGAAVLTDPNGLHTYRLTVLGSTANLYIDNDPSAILTGGASYSSNGIGNMYWADVSGGNWSNFDLESMSWTNQGAFAPIAPAASLTWNNTGGTGDGMTWDVGTNQNWNNGSGPATYSDGSDVTFDDNNVNNYAVALNTPVSPGSVTFANNNAPYTISGTGSIGGAGSLTMSGTSTVFLSNTGGNTYSGGTNVSAGTLVIGAAGALPAGGAISITGGALQLAANTGGETLSSLSISAGGFLDVGNNHVIISDPGGSIDATIRGYLANGYNNGSWHGTSGAATGGGIGSSSATGTQYGIGYADGADGGISGITSGQLEVKYTLYGDANLDGSVNSIDFGNMAANFGKSGKVWDQGDFNYDGVVNSIDFGLLAGNFGKSVGGNADVTSADWAALDAFASANGLMADVPEPATTGLLALGIVGVLTRRRRSVSGTRPLVA
jgi:autotransporter-associated beta strand protein